MQRPAHNCTLQQTKPSGRQTDRERKSSPKRKPCGHLLRGRMQGSRQGYARLAGMQPHMPPYAYAHRHAHMYATRHTTRHQQQHPRMQAAKTQVCALTVRHGRWQASRMLTAAGAARGHGQATCCYQPPSHASLPTDTPHSRHHPQLTHSHPTSLTVRPSRAHSPPTGHSHRVGGQRSPTHKRRLMQGTPALATAPALSFQQPNQHTGHLCTVRDHKHTRQLAADCRPRPDTQQVVCAQPARASLIKRPHYLPPAHHLLLRRKCFFRLKRLSLSPRTKPLPRRLHHCRCWLLRCAHGTRRNRRCCCCRRLLLLPAAACWQTAAYKK